MSQIIRLKRGNSGVGFDNLVLQNGEVAVLLDKKQLFIGTDGTAQGKVKIGDVIFSATAPAVAGNEEKLWLDTTSNQIHRVVAGAWKSVVGFIETDINAPYSDEKSYSTQAIRDILSGYVTVEEYEATALANNDKNVEQDGRIQDLEDAEAAAKLSTAKSADGGVTPKTFASVDARLEEIEADHKTEVERAVSEEERIEGKVDSNKQAYDQYVTDNNTRVSAVESKNTSQDSAIADLESNKEDKANKGQANGYAPLDSNALIPLIHLPNQVKESRVVADIAARDAITEKFEGLFVTVLDATADATVASGGAQYVYDGVQFVKTSELGNLDHIVDWSEVTNKPTSPVADIDDAVAKKHSHENKAVLDQLVAAGNAGKYVRINSAGDGLEFVDYIDGGSF